MTSSVTERDRERLGRDAPGPVPLSPSPAPVAPQSAAGPTERSDAEPAAHAGSASPYPPELLLGDPGREARGADQAAGGAPEHLELQALEPTGAAVRVAGEWRRGGHDDNRSPAREHRVARAAVGASGEPDGDPRIPDPDVPQRQLGEPRRK